MRKGNGAWRGGAAVLAGAAAAGLVVAQALPASAASIPAAHIRTIAVRGGEEEQLTVPDGATVAHIKLAGASGGKSGRGTAGGAGLEITGDLTVKPGEVLTVAAGAQGGDADGKKAPGNGGWGLTGTLSGGRGGSSRGAGAYADGGGGGGASVIQIGGADVVIAAGGGGGAFDVGLGGNGGDTSGQTGFGQKGRSHGGADGTSWDAAGSSITGHIGDGGGGGGGGAHNGEGGAAGAFGGGGGGGGSSKTGTLEPGYRISESTGGGSFVIVFS